MQFVKCGLKWLANDRSSQRLINLFLSIFSNSQIAAHKYEFSPQISLIDYPQIFVKKYSDGSSS